MAVTVDSDITGIASTASAAYSSFVSVGTTPATSGSVRIPSLGSIAFRNAANDGNVFAMALDSNDDIVIGVGPAAEIMVGADNLGKLGFFGEAPSTQPTAITSASGGGVIDAEARTALNSLLAKLRTLGIIDT